MSANDSKTFDVDYPADYSIAELAGTTVKYDVTIKAVRKRVVPDLDDELAKDMGDFESLDALRTRVRADLEHEATHEAEREMRAELLKQLASRVQFDVPASLVDREIDRRVEEFVRRLIEQQIDPMRTNINWEEFRERQKEAASEAVKSALVLDEVARREGLYRLRRAKWTRKCSGMQSGPAGACPRFAPDSRRRAASVASIRGCAVRKRSISCCRRRPSLKTVELPPIKGTLTLSACAREKVSIPFSGAVVHFAETATPFPTSPAHSHAHVLRGLF